MKNWRIERSAQVKNAKLEVPEEWNVLRDEFYDIDPWDNSISEELKFDNVFVQEDLFLLKLNDYHLDLGWYGDENNGFFELYLFRGEDWHNNLLFEKRRITSYAYLIEMINKIALNVPSGKYDHLNGQLKSMDDYFAQKELITIP